DVLPADDSELVPARLRPDGDDPHHEGDRAGALHHRHRFWAGDARELARWDAHLSAGAAGLWHESGRDLHDGPGQPGKAHVVGRLIRGRTMLTKEENDLLTRTGPGTPCGDFMRRYWQPVALAEELEPDGPPVAARLLGEDLVVYRDLQGRLGVLGRWCSHRGTDLRYGSVEEAGLRCGYHGWLYNHAGRCLEQPLEPPDSTLKDEIQHKAYPCQEHAGIIFAYLGPGEPPLMPSYEFFQVP